MRPLSSQQGTFRVLCYGHFSCLVFPFPPREFIFHPLYFLLFIELNSAGELFPLLVIVKELLLFAYSVLWSYCRIIFFCFLLHFLDLNNSFICFIDQLAGSDANKSTIVGKGGMDKLIKLSARYADDPSILQEVRPYNFRLGSLCKQFKSSLLDILLQVQ